METELWKPVPIPQYAERYEISTLGRLRNRETGKLMSPHIQTKGYRQAVLCVKRETKWVLVHRLVAGVWLPRTDRDRNQINHIDGDKTNNRLTNLEWCTGSENMQHAIKLRRARAAAI